MLTNKIYQNFIKEILKTFFVVLFGLSVIAWTVRAVNFLDLIVENGYSVAIYFHYSLLNFFGILTKFIPLAFLISLTIFILKQIHENEFIILWTSGVKKLKIVNLFLITSLLILCFYLFFSIFLTPMALNKSRILLSKDGFNSFLPTIRIQQFSDSFKGFTFIVEKKFKNEIKNVFIHDSSNTLRNLTSESSNDNLKTITAEEGLVEEKRMILFNGEIISTQKNSLKSEIIKFQQLNIDLKNLQTDTIKIPKLQETSTKELVLCLFSSSRINNVNCKKDTKREISTILNRRIVLPLYIPILSLICSFLLIKNSKNKFFTNKYSIFLLSFLVLLFAELIIRYTGISKLVGIIFLLTPIILIPTIYLTLMFKFSRESLSK
jgi:lipopolysaccharide export system permease protein|tara:strand:+ start:170 stop:1303 length:1134 start_codon:yes stop_codon:yes gene_type:complete